MRVQTKAPSGPWKSRPQGMRRWASVRQAPAIAVFVAITMFAAPVLAAESVLTLEDALERALLHHPAMWDADAEALQTELAWERQQARRRLQASVRTTVIGARFDPEKDEAIRISSSLMLDRPVTYNVDWQLAAGTSLSLSGAVEESPSGQDSALLRLTLNRQLWPNPNLSDDELARQNALEAVEELPDRAREAKASVLLDVYRRYRALQIQEARVGLSAAQADTASQRYSTIVAQYEAGLVSAEAVAQAELERDRAQAGLERAQREFTMSLRAFARDLGMDDADGLQLAPLPEELDYQNLSISRDDAVERAIASSRELRDAQRSLRAAKTRLDAVKASRLSVNLSAGATLRAWDADPVFSASIGASYNLADGGASDIQRREAELNVERAQRALEAARAKVEADVDSRLSNLAWLADQVRFAERALDLATLEYEVRVEQQRLGIATEKSVEESRWAMEEARWAYVEAVVAYQTAQWELLILMGEELEVARLME